MLPPPDSCLALVLNADFRPLSYFPLSLWSWQEAIKAVFLDRVNIVAEYDHVVRSPSFEMRLPSVISLKEYIPAARRPAFTRFNVFLRDRFTCQYCGHRFPPHELTTFLLQENGRSFPPNFLHESWRDYLYWDVELEA